MTSGVKVLATWEGKSFSTFCCKHSNLLPCELKHYLHAWGTLKLLCWFSLVKRFNFTEKIPTFLPDLIALLVREGRKTRRAVYIKRLGFCATSTNLLKWNVYSSIPNKRLSSPAHCYWQFLVFPQGKAVCKKARQLLFNYSNVITSLDGFWGAPVIWCIRVCLP